MPLHGPLSAWRFMHSLYGDFFGMTKPTHPESTHQEQTQNNSNFDRSKLAFSPVEPWSPATFPIALEDGGRGTGTGHVKGPLGLAVLRKPSAKGMPTQWAVTHLPSGWMICVLSGTLATAKRICDDLVMNVWWRFDDPHVMQSPDWRRVFCATLLEHAAHVHAPSGAKLLEGTRGLSTTAG